MSSTLIHTPPSRLQPDDLHCCFSAPMEKDCILCKQGEISGLVTDTKAQVVSFVSCAAAAFAAASALAFPVEIKLLSLVCAAHLQIATLSGKRMAQILHNSSAVPLQSLSQTAQQWVSDLIYTLDPWPLTEPDRFQSTKTHVSMPCPSPSHISMAQYSFLKWYAQTQTCFQTLNPSFLVHMASHTVLSWIERPQNQP